MPLGLLWCFVLLLRYLTKKPEFVNFGATGEKGRRGARGCEMGQERGDAVKGGEKGLGGQKQRCGARERVKIVRLAVKRSMVKKQVQQVKKERGARWGQRERGRS